jgi:two-component system chemotaxis sensor kinase CheA
MDEIVIGFIEEVRELLLQLEDDLIGLEENPGNADTINNIFRVMHTLKGSAGMVGFKNIQDLTHEFESVYEQVREGELPLSPEIIDLTLKGKDLLLLMVNGENDEKATAEILTGISSIIVRVEDQVVAEPALKSKATVPSLHFYVVFFSPDKAVFERGLDPDKVIQELKTTGDTYILLHETKKPWALQKEEKICLTTWEAYVGSTMTVTDLADVFMFYDQEEVQIFDVTERNLKSVPELSKTLKRFYKRKIEPDQHLKDCLDHVTSVQNEQPAALPDMDDLPAREAPSSVLPKADVESTVNVASHKLDELMNLVSELVTITATLEVEASRFKDTRLGNSIENIEKLTKNFRNIALDLRLVPVGTLLTKFKRQVRDLSKELNKKVNLLIEGQEIEIDKTILKSIESPLQHIIRNSIDHGLEPEEERLAKGKSPEGLLKITAFHSGASVIIQVQDDGRGINIERVQECAIKKGLINVNQAVTKQELINLILEPGFSTSENVSMVSGRGVGMDVVKKELSTVGGSLEIFTEKDLGTSITMKLPTTLTIIDTLLVNVGETQILIPVTDIEYCFKESSVNLFQKDNKYIEFKNYPIPLISLREQFHYPVFGQDEHMVIVINKFDQKYAITADQILGEHQAVIKPLGDLFSNQPLFSGGSIMVDGKLAFILDTNFLFNHAAKN